jgi:rhodanese-related sulfurtransferase
MKKYLLSLIFLIFAGVGLYSQTKKDAVEISLQFLNNLEQQSIEANKTFIADARATDEFDRKMKEAWNFHSQRLGKFDALKSIKYDEFKDYEIVYLICQFEKSDYTIKFVFNKNLKITDVYFIPYPPLIPAGKLNNLWIIAFFVLWELAWKSLGLWKAAQNHQMSWFIVIFILPTFGLLPIFYVMFVKSRLNYNHRD